MRINRLTIFLFESVIDLKLLALGDVVSDSGCEALLKNLPKIKRQYRIDVCIANGENSAKGNGISPDSAESLFSSGVDLITTGNHVFRRREAADYLDESRFCLRPYNMHGSCPGKGIGIIDMGKYHVGVINLIGNAFFNSSFANPFDSLDRAIEEIKDCRIKVVDFHAEATGEKRALGFYADGRVSAFFGTHTHVRTADEQILPQGTGYITDIGMCGSENSVLGIEPDCIIRSLKTGMPTVFKAKDDGIVISGCIFEIDESTGKAVAVEAIDIKSRE